MTKIFKINTAYTTYNNNNGYSALGPVWQEPEPSQANGMALIRCILGKFLGIVCLCFSPHHIYLLINAIARTRYISCPLSTRFSNFRFLFT